MIERQLQAEYILKSLVNFSQVVLQYDDNRSDSYQEDVWGQFALNPRIPNEYLGLQDLNSEIYLEIIPRNSKLSVARLARVNCSSSEDDSKNPFAESFENLFQILGFDNDLDEEETSGEFQGRSFKSVDLVGNIIDWQDRNNDSCDDGNYFGIESSVDKDSIPNREFTFIAQLDAVPGVTARRLHALAPFVATYGPREGSVQNVNINTATDTVLRAIGLDQEIQDIRLEIETSGPLSSVPEELIPDQRIRDMLTYQSYNFDVYGKVKYGLERAYYMKGRVKKGFRGRPSEVISATYF